MSIMYIVGGILFSIYMFFTIWNIIHKITSGIRAGSSKNPDGLGNKSKSLFLHESMSAAVFIVAVIFGVSLRKRIVQIPSLRRNGLRDLWQI